MSERIHRRPPAQESGDPVCTYPPACDSGSPICYRLEPEKRLTPQFDSCCIAEFPVSRPGKMGFRVVDNCCEDNIQ